MRANVRFWVWVGLSLILSGCGNNGGGSRAIAVIEISPNPANLEPGGKVQLSAVARTASGAAIENVAFSWRSGDPSIVTIDPNGLATGVKLGVTSIIASTLARTGSAPVGVVSPNSGGTNFTVSGKASYEDKPFNEAGFTGQLELKPIRNTVVNVIAIDGFVTLATSSTDPNGNFSFPGLNNNLRRGGIYLQVSTQTATGHPTQVGIRNNLSDRAIFAMVSSALDDSTGVPLTGVEATATASSGIGGAFNILDTFSSASELIQQSGPCPTATEPAAPCVPPLLVAYWEPGSAEGTYYDDFQDAIFICGGGICVPGSSPGDTDEYDDAVIAHEYGHFVARHFSQDDSPGGQHRINDNTQDIRLSWSEGWGNFFSSAVRKSPFYVDTAGDGTFSFNLENYTSPNFPTADSLSNKTIYTTSEVAVAGVLWDLFDPAATILEPTESHDQLELEFNPIWQTVLQMKNGSATPIPASMESFWFQFMANQSAPKPDQLKAIMRERQMKLFPPEDDAYEGDENLTPLLNDGLQKHTFYRNAQDPVGDEDIIPFKVVQNQTYTIDTLNLTNGADTLLTITDQAGIPLFPESDNRNKVNYKNCTVNFLGKSTCPPNDQTTLSSSITFLWSGNSTTLIAQVEHSPNAPPSAGRLGAYDIRLSQP